MAVTKDDLLVAIKADTKDANVQLAAFSKSFEKLDEAMNAVVSSLNKTEKQVTGFGAAMLQLNAAVELGQKAWDMLSAPIARAVAEAEEAATAFDKTRITLKFFGEKDAETAANGFKEVADSIELATGASAESSLVFASQAKAFGLSNDRVKQLLQASSDLAAIMGTDVDSAGKALLATMNGQTKAVEKYVPQLQGMTLAQLKDGEAIDLVAKKLGGLGEAFGQTAEGINKRLDAAIGKPFEAAGNIIIEAFDVIANKEEKIKFLEGLERQINEVKPIVLSFVQLMKESFTAIAVAAAGAFVVANIGAWVKAIQIATAATKAQGVATVLLSKAQSVLNIAAIKFVGLASLFLLVGAAVETIAKNMGNLGNVWELVSSRILAAGNRIISIFSKIAGNDEAAQRFEDAADSYAIAADRVSRKVEVGAFGKALQSVSNFAQVAQGDLSSLNKEAKVTKDIMSGITAPEGIGKTGEMAKEVTDKLKDLGSTIASLNAAAQSAPGNELQAIQAKLAADQMSLDIKAQEIADSDKLAGKEARRLAEIGKRIQAEIAAKDIGEKQRKIFEDQANRVKDIQNEYESYGKTQREVIDLQLSRAMELLDLEEQRLEKTGLMTEEIRQQFELQRGGLTATAENKKKDTVSTAFEGSKKIGEDIGKAISGQFSEGIQGQIMGMMSGIGSMVSAAQAVVDAGPQLLDSIANLIGSITELPLKLLAGVTQIFNNLSGFFTSFVENIGTMVNGLLEAIVGFIEKIPELLVKFITDIPRIIGNLFDKLPDIIQRLITALIEAAPRIAVGLITFLVKDAPKIAIGIMKTLIIELPKAIIKAIVSAVKNIFNVIFGGGSFKSFLTKDIPNAIGSGLKKLTGVSSKLFSVKDLADSIGADDKANKILEQIEAAGKGAYDWITKAWIWVYENIIKPIGQFLMYIWEGLKIVGTFVVGIFKGAWESLKSAAYFVRDILMAVWNFVVSIFKTIIDSFMAVWNFVVTLFDDPIAAFKNLWEDVKNIFSDTIDAFANFFGGLWDSFKNYGARIWEGFQEAVGGVVNMFTAMGRWIWEGVTSVTNGIGSFFSELGKNIWGGFTGGTEKIKKFFRELGTQIWDGLSDGLSSIGSGVGGAWDDFTSALGNIDFGFSQGGIVGGAALVSGDSKTNDIIPAFLSPGEAVIPRSLMANPEINELVKRILSRDVRVVSKSFLPKNLMEMLSMNTKGMIPGFANGGIVDAPLSLGEFSMGKPAVQGIGVSAIQSINSNGRIPQSNNTYTFNIDMKFDMKDPVDENSIRNRIIPRIKEEIKRASMNGEYVVNSKGVRT